MVCATQARAQVSTTAKPKSLPVAVYITAHPDDWQLFMGADACADVQRPRSKTVFICLTGGQADVPGDVYWKGREAGCQAAVRKAANLLTPTIDQAPASQSIVFNNHAVTMVRYRGGAVAYFLRLPDGGLDGKGQGRGAFQSMAMLLRQNRSMTPLDGSATYTSWDDLVKTVRLILKKEVCNNPVNLHTPQPNERYNPGDHSDHRMAGRLALAATNQIECRTMLYMGYNSRLRPFNLSAAQKANQQDVYQAYSQTMAGLGLPSGWEPSHLQFIGRQYSYVWHRDGQVFDNQPEPVLQATTTDVENKAPVVQALPSSLALEPNYPNPFGQSSLMAYQLPATAAVWLRVLDAQGREVLRLLNGEQQQAGRHEQWLDVSNFPAAGLYIAELRVGDQRRTCRMEIIR